LIRLENVSYEHPGAPPGRRLDSISLTINDGEWVTIAGGNGSGKTTLCRLIAGLAEPSAGTAEIDGLAAFGALRAVRGEAAVGVAFQDPDSQFVTARVVDEIRFGMENLGLDRSRIESRCDEALALFDLERNGGRNPHMLSGGEKQRLILAALWSMSPRHLILDEPFSFLDKGAREAFLAALRSSFKNEGRTVVWATVARDEVDLADRVVFMENGRIRFDGRPADLEAALPREAIERALVHPAPDASGRNPRGGTGAANSSPLLYMNNVHPSPDGSPAFIHMQHALFSPEGGDFELHVPSFTLSRGECVGVFGPSGSGKTTFLLGCAGLLSPRSGSVTIFGKPIASRRDFPAGRIAYLFQTPEQGFFAPTVREEVALGHCSFRGRSGEAEAVAHALERVGLAPPAFLDRSPFQLSEGEKRLAALASVLVLEAPVLVLDEPTIFLDGKGRGNLFSALADLRASGTSIIIASHDRAMLDSFAGSVVSLENGEIR
jgi:energy-coupling factor transport system ATP-binding protein